MKNALYKTKVYLVGPMEYTEDGRSWREDMTKFLHEMNVIVFDPYKKPFIESPSEDEVARAHLKEKMQDGDFEYIHEHMKKVRAMDLSMVDKSDFIIAYIDPKIPTIGTIEEIVTACRMKKPTFIVIEGGIKNTPLWLLGMFPPKYFYNDFKELKNIISTIDKEERKLDSDRWRLLKPELR